MRNNPQYIGTTITDAERARYAPYGVTVIEPGPMRKRNWWRIFEWSWEVAWVLLWIVTGWCLCLLWGAL